MDALTSATVTTTSLQLPESLTFEQWRELCSRLERRASTTMWFLADALAYGDLHFRREYGPALDRIYARQSLKNLASVSRRVAPEQRREDLSFSHHAAVAALSVEDQTRWLAAAAREDWGVAELRERLGAERGRRPGVGAALTIRVGGDELRELVERAAALERLAPTAWASRTLEHAARLVLAGEASLERAALDRGAALVA